MLGAIKGALTSCGRFSLDGKTFRDTGVGVGLSGADAADTYHIFCAEAEPGRPRCFFLPASADRLTEFVLPGGTPRDEQLRFLASIAQRFALAIARQPARSTPCAERVNPGHAAKIRRSHHKIVIDRWEAWVLRGHGTAPRIPGPPPPGRPSARDRVRPRHGTATHIFRPPECTMTNDAGAWHAKLQREQEAIQRKRAQQASRTPAGTSATPR